MYSKKELNKSLLNVVFINPEVASIKVAKEIVLEGRVNKSVLESLFFQEYASKEAISFHSLFNAYNKWIESVEDVFADFSDRVKGIEDLSMKTKEIMTTIRFGPKINSNILNKYNELFIKGLKEDSFDFKLHVDAEVKIGKVMKKVGLINEIYESGYRLRVDEITLRYLESLSFYLNGKPENIVVDENVINYFKNRIDLNHNQKSIYFLNEELKKDLINVSNDLIEALKGKYINKKENTFLSNKMFNEISKWGVEKNNDVDMAVANNISEDMGKGERLVVSTYKRNEK